MEEPEKPKRSIMELQGLGAELWRSIDVDAYIAETRAEWDERDRSILLAHWESMTQAKKESLRDVREFVGIGKELWKVSDEQKSMDDVQNAME